MAVAQLPHSPAINSGGLIINYESPNTGSVWFVTLTSCQFGVPLGLFIMYTGLGFHCVHGVSV